MSGRGRPLRFVATVVGGWTAARVFLLWPTIDSVPALIHALAPPALAATAPDVSAGSPILMRGATVTRSKPSAAARIGAASSPGAPRRAAVLAPPVALALALADHATVGAVPVQGWPGYRAPVAPHRSRLSGSAWVLLRGAGGKGSLGGLGASQLGGAQAGLRLAYALDTRHRLALTARLSGALRERQREAAIGVAWQPSRLPIQLVVEQRIALDGGRSGPAIGAIGGLNPTPIVAGFRLELYGQAGAILHRGAFTDGSARLARPLAALGPARLDLGIGAWGGAQRGAARADVGPSLGVAVPIASHQLRLTLDWRQRVAGSASPGSGPALSLGTDF